ncbi:MAG: uroporphyrinogen decarboxylase family protein [Victivallales bacterium]
MNGRERFRAIMEYREFDRIPVWYFGTWEETKVRWGNEGLPAAAKLGGSGGPQLPEMDPDWETNTATGGQIWNNQGLMNRSTVAPGKSVVVEETAEYRIIRSSLGGLSKHSKLGSSIPEHIEYDLKPTRGDWERFMTYLDPDDPGRWIEGWEKKIEFLKKREHVTCFNAGGLFGYLREWMGVENFSCLPYDDPELYGDMISYMADYFLRLNARFLDKVSFDFGYFHEDCCFNTGPFISPDIYRQFYDRHYRRMIDAFHDMGVPFLLLDSDGKLDDLIPCWLDSGFDIVFPIEVGTWKANPVELRKKHGKRLRMMGGVNKHVIPKGEAAIRAELEPLKPLVKEGGFIPFPDHRIPPDCSLEQFRIYLKIYKEVFGINSIDRIT